MTGRAIAAVLLLSGGPACGRRGFDATYRDALADDAWAPEGCADGQRDSFSDRVRFPTIAGCIASWSGSKDLRGMRSQPQKACGDDFGNGAVSCLVPADACAVGWHICADTGEPSDLTSRLTSAECATEPGSFVGAAAHCENCAAPCMAESDCVYKRLPGDTAYGCPVAVLACSEPACCGASCGGNNNCKDAFFTLSTRTALRSACGAMLDTTQDGVLCCAD